MGRAFADLYRARSESAPSDIALRSSRTVAFRRDAWAAVGGYPEQLKLAGEDTLFFMDLERRFEVAEAPEACVHWWHGMDSLRSVYGVHRRNAIGAGEANYWTSRFLIVAAAYAAALGAAGSRRLPLAARWPPLAAIGARDLPRVYRVTRRARSLAMAALTCFSTPVLYIYEGRSMKAIYIEQTGSPDVLKYGDMPKPEIAAGQALVKVAASGVNFIDTYHRTGLYKIPLPLFSAPKARGRWNRGRFLRKAIESLGPWCADLMPNTLLCRNRCWLPCRIPSAFRMARRPCFKA